MPLPLSWRFSCAYWASFPFHRPNQMTSGTTPLVSTMPWKCICQHNTSKSGPSASPWIECFLLDPPFVVKVPQFPQSPYMSHGVLWDSFFLPLHHRPEPHLSVLPFQYCSSPSFLPIFTIQVPAQTSRVWTFAIAFFGLISLSCFSPAKSEVSIMPCPCLLNGFLGWSSHLLKYFHSFLTGCWIKSRLFSVCYWKKEQSNYNKAQI